MSGSGEKNSARVMRAYRALRVTGRVATLMRSQGLKVAGAVNPTVLVIDAALSVLDVGRAYFRFSTEREKTRRLENDLKIARAQLAAEAAGEEDRIEFSRRELERRADTDRAVMSTFRLLEMAAKMLDEEIAALADRGDDPKLAVLTRRYEAFMGRYMRAVERSDIRGDAGEEE